MKLIVRTPFADYRVGDEITAPKEIAAALATNEMFVVKVASDATQAPPSPNAALKPDKE